MMSKKNRHLKKSHEMKKKIVLWGTDAEDKKVLIALELKSKENQVNVYTFKEDIVSEVFYNQMMDDWRVGRPLEFPEGHELLVRELSVTEDILPETLKVQRGDLINRAKAEWHFVVLSNKLYDLYNNELGEIKDKLEQLVGFDSGIWDELKGFWGKISEQSRERNLFREHADKLKDETNVLFNKLKEFRTQANAELAKISKEHVANFTTKLDQVKTKVADGKSLSPLFDELKKIQKEFSGTEFTRNDRSKIWKRIDETFKLVKEKKYGKQESPQGGAVSRLERRYQGLKSAIGKMEASINRDKRDIDYQSGKSGRPMGQLEMQLRQAKVVMIEERISSKQEKLDEMLATKVELEKRMEKEKEREAKRAEKAEVEKKKAEVKEKMKAEMAENKPEISEEKAAKLAAAAEDINKPRGKKKTKKSEEATAAQKEETASSDKAPQAATAIAVDTAPPKDGEAKVEENKDVAVVSEKVTEEKASPSEEVSTTEVGDAEVTEETSLLGAASAMIEDAVENVVDTVKAVSAVIADKVEEHTENVKEAAGDAKEALSENVEAEAGSESSTSGTLLKGGLLATAVAAGSKLVKDASEKLGEISEKVGLDDAIENVTETAKDTVEEAKDAVKEKAEDVAEASEELAEKVEGKEAETKTLKADITTAAESTQEDEVAAKAGETLMKGGLLATAVAAGAKLVKDASEKVGDLSEKMGLDETIEKAKDMLEDTKEAIADKVEDAKEAVSGKVEAATETVDEVADRVRAETDKPDASAEEE